jgi:predicted transcriptional regulator YdeE
MVPEIKQYPQRYLAGFSFFGNPFEQFSGWTEENEIGRLWVRYMAYLRQHGDQLPAAMEAAEEQGVAYEVHIYHPETVERGEFEVFVGHLIADPRQIPTILSVKVLPAAPYAVFTLRDRQIVGDWGLEIYQGWLPGSGFRSDFAFNYQRYDSRFHGLDRLEGSTLEVHIPLQPAGS